MPPRDPIDIVFTWVDDSFEGYLDLRDAHAGDARDRNPNRTRDNLEILRFALRSVHRHLPQAGRIHLLTCRPQVPPWLDPDHPRLRVTHHDQVIEDRHLPTFNSFCIVSHLHRLPGLAPRFLYVEDDMLVLRDGLLDALAPPGGPPLALFNREPTLPQARLDPATASPWNLALAASDAALDRRFPRRARRHIIHGPLLIDRDQFAAMTETFAPEIAATRAEKFRSARCIAPEYVYPHLMVEEGHARPGTVAEARRVEGFVSVENLAPWTWAQLRWLEARAPLTATLNDSFEQRPNPRVVRMVRRWLEHRFPDPAPWERA